MKKNSFDIGFCFFRFNAGVDIACEKNLQLFREERQSLGKSENGFFWLDVLSTNEFEIHQNAASDSFLDINVLMPISAGKISSRGHYDFLKEGYLVSLSNTKIIGKDKEVTWVNNPNDANHNKIIESMKSLVFNTYQKEISK